MGAVYRALHLGTKRAVAVKVIRPRYANDEEFVGRFRREAEAAGRLRHPNVVDVTDFGFAPTAGGRVAYLVMEYLDGCTLAEVLAEERRLHRDFVVDILSQACSAVSEAHRVGIVHRDLKPENVWLEPNRRGGYTVKVLDFGLVKMDVAKMDPASPRETPVVPPVLSLITESPTLARPPAAEDAPGPRHLQARDPPRAASAQGEDERDGSSDGAPGAETPGELTRVGSLLGTPLYMSPEQCRGEPLDGRSDVYSLGVIAYRMLAGETPFAGTAEELFRAHATSPPRPIDEVARVPKRVARVVMSALAKERAARPQTADAFAAAMKAAAEGSGALLRQATALYGERFPPFFRVSLLGYAPLIAVVAGLYLIDGEEPWVRLAPGLMPMAGPVLLLAMVATNFLAQAVVSAVTVPLVVESILAPLRALRVRTALAVLGRRAWTFALATIAVMLMVAGGTVALLVPGVLALLAHALYAPVTVMEGGPVRSALRRARSLARRSWTTVLVITALQFALPILVWRASVNVSVTWELDDHYRLRSWGYGLSTSGKAALFQLLNVFVTPLTSIMSALLYLKMRQAGGESLLDAAVRFDAIRLKQSGWQARLRARSVSTGHTGTGA